MVRNLRFAQYLWQIKWTEAKEFVAFKSMENYLVAVSGSQQQPASQLDGSQYISSFIKSNEHMVDKKILIF